MHRAQYNIQPDNDDDDNSLVDFYLVSGTAGEKYRFAKGISGARLADGFDGERHLYMLAVRYDKLWIRERGDKGETERYIIFFRSRLPILGAPESRS